jgi:hypothetical protein
MKQNCNILKFVRFCPKHKGFFCVYKDRNLPRPNSKLCCDDCKKHINELRTQRIKTTSLENIKNDNIFDLRKYCNYKR